MPSPKHTIGERSPRALVIDRAWRSLGPGLEPLSGPGGAPLTRTVKLIVLPLVVRPMLRPELAADFLGEREAALLDGLVRDAADRLAATAQWFTLLKKVRRALGVVAGNPQDLYFQICFELATEHGLPPVGAEALARAAVEEVAGSTDGRTVEALKEYLADPLRRSRLDGELVTAWESRRPDPADDAASAAVLAAEVLESCGAADPSATDPDGTRRDGNGREGNRRNGSGPDTSAFAALVADGCGSSLGRALWTESSGVWGREDLPPHLGLTGHQLPPCPEVGRAASTATLPAPLDRTLLERLFTVLQVSVRREELPTVPQLVQREVGRSCAPLGLDDESLRVTVLLGGCLAVGLDPLGRGGTGSGGTAAHRAVNARWQREASVLRARRMTVSARPDPDGGALDALAQDLRAPWAAYMRRLWVRLHGRDVRDAPLDDLASAWTLLDGVARSVMMDHRARVRSALRALSTAPAQVAGGEERLMPDTDSRITRAADGTVLVADTPGVHGAAFTRAVLDVAGAVLVRSVLDAPGPPTAQIHDPGQAQQWLWAVYGERVAAAVHACAVGGSQSVLVPPERTALAGSAARLALGHWAARWWPTSYLDGTPGLEPDVLGLELAALTHQCQQLSDTVGDSWDQDSAADLLTEHQAGLDPLIEWWRAAPPATGTADRLEGVLRLIDDAADSTGQDGPALRRLRISLDQRRHQRHQSGTQVDLGALFARNGDYALAAGDRTAAGGRVIARGSGTNDWQRYPPGYVDAADTAVSWAVRAVGARRQIEVDAVTVVGAPAGASLTAEVRVDGGPVQRIPLGRQDDRWSGAAVLELAAAALSPRIEVGVLLPGFDPGPEGGDGPGEVLRDAAARDAVRALVRRRLAVAAQPDLPCDASGEPFLAEIAAAATTVEDF